MVYEGGSVALVDELLEMGASANTIDNSSNSILYLAIKQRSFELAEKLIEMGADVNYKNRNNTSILDIATDVKNEIDKNINSKEYQNSKNLKQHLDHQRKDINKIIELIK